MFITMIHKYSILLVSHIISDATLLSGYKVLINENMSVRFPLI